MNKVLVLMATYNGEKYLEEQIESIKEQEGVIVEILVRDDGSTDSTIEILNRNHIEWYSDGHLGVKYGFYELMQKSADKDWDYIAFCDQDDVWDTNKLKVAIEQLDKQNNSIPCLYYCGQRLVDSELNHIRNHILNKDRSIYARFLLNDAAGCTEVFNRKLVDEVIKYKPDYLLMHDAWLVKVCLALGGKVIVDPQVHMSYRQHGNNVVGLKRDIFSKLKHAKYYINEQDVESQMMELKKGYYDFIIPEYKEIVDAVLAYKKDREIRKYLLDKNRFYYADKGLQGTYWLKIMLNKL